MKRCWVLRIGEGANGFDKGDICVFEAFGEFPNGLIVFLLVGFEAEVI